MKTEIEEIELNTELQELYLKSKQWIAEIDFFQLDLEFLKKHIERNLSRLADDKDFVCSSESLRKITSTAKLQADLKVRIIKYRGDLEPLITQSNQVIDLSLIENYNQFELELANILFRLGEIKTLAFTLTGKSLNYRNSV